MWPCTAQEADCRYQQKYAKEPLPQSWLNMFKSPGKDSRLAVPGLNPFTPENLDMLKPEEHPNSKDDEVPVCVLEDEMVCM
jgi:secreted Zn-dependent insulinase-like peptidase